MGEMMKIQKEKLEKSWCPSVWESSQPAYPFEKSAC